MRENYLASTSGEDPFADPPAADSSLFVPIGMVTERTGVLTEEEAAQAEGAPLLPVYETVSYTHLDVYKRHLHILGLHKAHLHVHLREFRLAVSAVVLVAEAARHLIVLIKACEH